MAEEKKGLFRGLIEKITGAVLPADAKTTIPDNERTTS